MRVSVTTAAGILCLWMLSLKAGAAISLFKLEPDNSLLTLVNWENPLPENWHSDLAEIENGYLVDTRIYEELSEMLSAMRAESLQPVICSAYRSEESQTALYHAEVNDYINQGFSEAEAEEKARFWVARPGTSEHQLGLAVDIIDEGWMRLDQEQENTPVQKWLMEHCHEYGFILRYPLDKSEKTGIGYEPWHYRYVGKKTAGLIKNGGLCLEEYLEMLRVIEKDDAESAPSFSILL